VFDLRTSPFYLLGVSPRDNRATIAQPDAQIALELWSILLCPHHREIR
jgi:hypothetical protein